MKINNRRILYIALFFICLIIVSEACLSKKEAIAPNDELTIQLKWNKAYDSETSIQVETGLRWCLSFLGASLPPNEYYKGIKWDSSNLIQLNIHKLGFNPNAVLALGQLVNQIKKSDEYKQTKAIDIGRFIMLTLNSSNHYYKITGVEKFYNNFVSKYSFDSKRFGVIESYVSKGNRSISLPKSDSVLKWGFIAAELREKLTSPQIKETTHEVMDVMPNGQLRFATYNEKNELVTASNPTYTASGKPAKCLWCHEVNVQRAFIAVTSTPGYYSIDTFALIVNHFQQKLINYRNTLVTKIDYSKKQDHTQLEILYISFMEPSAKRLANEWGISEQEVKVRLKKLNTHSHHEFPFLGELYDRNELAPYSPFLGLKTPDSARELSTYEPNLIL